MEKNTKIKRVLFVIVAMYVFLLLYLAYFQIAKSNEIASHSYNPRKRVDESEFQRGSIKDRNANVLAESVLIGENSYERVYNYGDLFGHMTGYSSVDYGKTGLEHAFNDTLLNIEEETPIDDIKKILQEESKGNNIVTTLDLDLQKKAAELMHGHKGSVVVMDVETGDVYSMYSKPNYDPNYIEENWEALINDPDSALLNRSVQGLYTPGSVIKIITAVAIMESDLSLLYNDTGSTVVDGYTINNFENAAHGEINMEWALVHSSNTYFVDKAMELGVDKMKEVFEKFMFNQQIYFDLVPEISTHPFEEGMDPNAYAAAAYGQGTTLVTPLQMAMSMAALANDGDMVEPRILKEIEDVETGQVKKVAESGRVISQVTSPEIAQELQSYFGSVVENYATATTYNTRSGGKTGTAETASGLNHAWYVGFAPLDKPRFAVSVILEEDGTLGGMTAAPIGAAMLDQAVLVIE